MPTKRSKAATEETIHMLRFTADAAEPANVEEYYFACGARTALDIAWKVVSGKYDRTLHTADGFWATTDAEIDQAAIDQLRVHMRANCKAARDMLPFQRFAGVES